MSRKSPRAQYGQSLNSMSVHLTERHANYVWWSTFAMIKFKLYDKIEAISSEGVIFLKENIVQ